MEDKRQEALLKVLMSMNIAVGIMAELSLEVEKAMRQLKEVVLNDMKEAEGGKNEPG